MLSPWILLLPIIGWIFFAMDRFSSSGNRYGRCTRFVRDTSDKGVQAVVGESLTSTTDFKYASNIREFGPCGLEGKLWEGRLG